MAYKAKIRLFVDAPLSAGATVPLQGDSRHYLINVLRLGLGDVVHIFNGRDGEWASEITDLTKKAMVLTAQEQTRGQSCEPDVWLVFAPVKKARVDFIAQKATELGVSRLMPVFTHHTSSERVKVERLQANAIEAAEQCERLNVPGVDAPRKLVDVLSDWPPDRAIMFCDEDLSASNAVEALSNLDEATKNASWAILIGPEGGFSDDERKMIRAMDKSVPVTLGPRILRADTAALAAISLWQSVLGDWQ